MRRITNLVTRLSRAREQVLLPGGRNAGYIELSKGKALPRKELSKAGGLRTFSEQAAGALTDLVTGLSRLLDRLAGLCMVAMMLLVVANVLLRALFKRPILGTYEYVGFLAAAVIGLSLAYCAVQNGHIAVSFVVDRLSPRMQAIVDIIVNALALCFWSLSTWHVGKYAYSISVNGVVSSTTQTPLYYFVYLVAFGLSVLCLVLLVKVVESIKKAVAG